jgi:hypothetical protein
VPNPLNSDTGNIVDGVSFSTIDGGGFSLSVVAPSIFRTTQSDAMDIDFLIPVTAFGFDYVRQFNIGYELTIDFFAPDDQTLLATEQFDLSFNYFVGFHEPNGIGRIEITSFGADATGTITDGSVGMGNFTFGVPEPSTALLVGLGLVGLGGARRRA